MPLGHDLEALPAYADRLQSTGPLVPRTPRPSRQRPLGRRLRALVHLPRSGRTTRPSRPVTP